MVVADIIRDAPLGQLIRWVSRRKYLKYPEEKEGFQLPETWTDLVNNPDQPIDAPPDTQQNPPDGEPSDSRSRSSSTVGGEEEERKLRPRNGDLGDLDRDPEKLHSPPNDPSSSDDNGGEGSQEPLQRGPATQPLEPHGDADEANVAGIERTRSVPVVPKRTRDGLILVDWYYNDDEENPHNWSNGKRGAIATILCLYTFVVYTSSAIYTSSEQGIMKEFGVSEVKATLGLSLYVLGYGTGPLLFSPLSEIPRIGRNPVYIVTMIIYVILTIPTAFAPTYAGLMVLRFLTGFFGSPCLASGGASLGDMYSLLNLPYALIAWVAAAYCGPALGPLLSGFAVPAESWRWSLFISIWASAPVALAMFLFLPETSTPTLLLRRARRLRRLTGNERFMSQSEIDQRNLKVSEVAVDALIKPMEITLKDPAILFVQVYTGIIYGIYYSFFEVFPLVYAGFYGMNMGEIGLVFLCILVSCIIGIVIYIFWLVHQNRRIVKFGMSVQENRLIPALPSSFGPTIGLFLFAWTARASIHWIVPTIGIVIYGASVFIVVQCIFVYIPLSYPMYAASLFAANDFFRSAFAAGSVIIAHPLYANLGVHRGTSLLGGLSVIGIIGIWLLYVYGAYLRSKSKFAISTITPTF